MRRPVLAGGIVTLAAGRLVICGEALEVEVVDGDLRAWQRAEVVAVLQDGWFQARIGHGDQAWSDWFTWQEEGTDWRRPPPRARRACPRP